jgi:hypothetical protein
MQKCNNPVVYFMTTKANHPVSLSHLPSRKEKKRRQAISYKSKIHHPPTKV